MHISEGILSLPVLAAGAGLAVAGTGLGLKSMSDRDMVKVAVVSSALFVATLIKVPLGPSSVHLILNGLFGGGDLPEKPAAPGAAEDLNTTRRQGRREATGIIRP